MDNIDIRFIKNVGDERAKALNKLGINTAYELLRHFPRGYIDWNDVSPISTAKTGETVIFSAKICEPFTIRRTGNNIIILKTRIGDDSGFAIITFFNQQYVKDSLKVGETYLFRGKVNITLFGCEMTSPSFLPLKKAAILPIYPLTSNISSAIMRTIVKSTLEKYGEELFDPLPDNIREKYSLCHQRFAYENVHFPANFVSLETARKRLIFEELLTLCLGIMHLKNHRETAKTAVVCETPPDAFINALPFKITNAQFRAINEIASDMKKNEPMRRLLQGDVGCGKTVIAAAAAYIAVKSGYQAAMMAPTEILANQHFESLEPMLSKLGIRCALLTGSQKVSEKRSVTQHLADGKIDFLIGTHAIIQEKVLFSSLGLVITDEQHRFGVKQRESLAKKGMSPHTLIMSATPIPRTLALMLYGDLDISIIDELPPGRQKVDTFLLDDEKRERAYGFIRKNIDEGRQAYVVCPLIEQNEDDDGMKAVEAFAKELETEIFKDYPIAFLHGKQKAAVKESIMSEFANGDIKILVSTTVIEVGVNVKNAAVMVIENAERFGLSQLHQLRGRVGRGEYKSYCMLMSNVKTPDSLERLKVMCKTNDGFIIAEKDLALRGPGDFFGDRQHGLPDLKIANLSSDMSIFKLAQQAAEEIYKNDPTLSKYENRGLLNIVNKFFE